MSMRSPPPIIDTPKTLGPVPDTGILGVGAGVVSVQAQFAWVEQEGFLHDPSIQTNPLEQSVLSVQALLQLAAVWAGVGVAVGLTTVCLGVGVGVDVGVGVGVAVAVGVGVGVAVFVGVGVGEPVLTVMLNVSVQAGTAACGSTW